MGRLNVFLEAIIGAGKTSVHQYLRKLRPGWIFHDEPIEAWRSWEGKNHLQLFYEDPQKNAYVFQQVVLKSYIKLLDNNEPGVHVYERSPRSAIAIFSLDALSRRSISEPQLHILKTFSDQFYSSESMKNPSLTFYLRTNPEVAYNRVLERARAEEMKGNVSLEYLIRLHQLHDAEFLPTTETLILDETEKGTSITEKAGFVVSLVEQHLEPAPLRLDAPSAKKVSGRKMAVSANHEAWHPGTV